MVLLSTLFLATAVFYSSVGFGGGSTYLVLLLIWDFSYLIFPVLALSCNIIVVSGNCFNYIKAGNINIQGGNSSYLTFLATEQISNIYIY